MNNLLLAMKFDSTFIKRLMNFSVKDTTNDPTIHPTINPWNDPATDTTLYPAKYPTYDPENDPIIEPTKNLTILLLQQEIFIMMNILILSLYSTNEYRFDL